MENSAFYTYALIDVRTGDPFYVGKGQKKRMYCHGGKNTQKANPHLYNKIHKLKSLGYKIIYEKWFEHEDEFPCLWLEHQLIKYFGRRDLGTGILCNLTDGGEGTAGATWTKESRTKLSAAKLGKPSAKKGKRYFFPLTTKGLERQKLKEVAQENRELQLQLQEFENEGGFISLPYQSDGRIPMLKSRNQDPVLRAKNRLRMKGNTNGRALKGRMFSAETLQKMRLAKLGKPALWNKGRKQSPKHLAKLSAVRKGKVPWNKKPNTA